MRSEKVLRAVLALEEALEDLGARGKLTISFSDRNDYERLVSICSAEFGLIPDRRLECNTTRARISRTVFTYWR